MNTWQLINNTNTFKNQSICQHRFRLNCPKTLKNHEILSLISNPLCVTSCVKLEISTTNQTGMNCDYILVVDVGLVLRIKTSERSSGRRDRPKKTDGRQTFPQQGSSGFYWQRQNLVQKVLSGCLGGSACTGRTRAAGRVSTVSAFQSCPLENSCRLHFWCQWSPDMIPRHSLCYCNHIFSLWFVEQPDLWTKLQPWSRPGHESTRPVVTFHACSPTAAFTGNNEKASCKFWIIPFCHGGYVSSRNVYRHFVRVSRLYITSAARIRLCNTTWGLQLSMQTCKYHRNPGKYLRTLNIYYFKKYRIDVIDSVQQLNMHKIYQSVQ